MDLQLQIAQRIKKACVIICLLACVNVLNGQTVWRVNNNSTLNADFTSVNAAMNSANVKDGDTLYIEPSSSTYGGISCKKRLTIIGNGYDLYGVAGNLGLQEDTLTAFFGSLSLNIGSDSIKLIGLEIDNIFFGTISQSANVVIEKCKITGSDALRTSGTKTLENITVRKSFFSSGSSSRIFKNSATTIKNLTVENCIFNSTAEILPSTSSTNLMFRNNTAQRLIARNTYVANNVFFASTASTFTSCVVRNNVFVSPSQTGITTGPINGAGAINGNNLIGQTLTGIIVNTGSNDGKYMLVAGSSPAIGGGVDIGGIKPDCGAFGGNDPYVLSGIPSIPTIYSLSLPNGNAIPVGTSALFIDFSTRSNN